MMTEKKYKIVFDRANCIGAAACTAAHPKRWAIVDDGKADLAGAKQKENNNI
ncbi:ferredoxin, partial [Candidatus Woesearchaeota archaeon]|nr:ferredoxin [Candidatus Woesearchaeota archaeon]